MKNHLFVTIMLATASLSSFATVEPTAADSATVDRGTIRKLSDDDKLSVNPGFSAVSPSGHKLFFRMINKKQKWVEVVDSCASYNAKLAGDLIIPATVNYGGTTYSVTSVGATAFMLVGGDEKKLQSVDIQEGVGTIGVAAFNGNSHLTSVNLPNSLKEIGECAFGGCDIHDLVVPGEHLSTIKQWSFSYPANVIVKEGIKTIEEGAIILSQESDYVRVELPSTIRTIKDGGISGNGSFSWQTLVLVMHKEKPIDMCYHYDYQPGQQFYGINPLEKFIVYVPAGCAEAYRNHKDWSLAKAILEIGTDIEDSEAVVESKFYSVNGLLYSKELVSYSVYNISGQCVYSGNKQELSLPQGFYIIKTDNYTEKILIR